MFVEAADDDRVVHIGTWWPRLTQDSRDWLMEHSGEPVDEDVKVDILAVNAGEPDARWWSDDSDPEDGQSELTDEAIDWLEATANGE